MAEQPCYLSAAACNLTTFFLSLKSVFLQRSLFIISLGHSLDRILNLVGFVQVVPSASFHLPTFNFHQLLSFNRTVLNQAGLINVSSFLLSISCLCLSRALNCVSAYQTSAARLIVSSRNTVS